MFHFIILNFKKDSFSSLNDFKMFFFVYIFVFKGPFGGE